MRILRQTFTTWLLLCCAAFTAWADSPPAKEGDWIARDFRFHTGDVMPEVRLHYTTLGSMRRMIMDSIRTDPAWNNGNYTTQPQAVRAANAYFGIVSNGGSQAYQKMAPTRAAADKLLDARLAAPFTADANDFLYQWDSSRDYNPAPQLERIRAPLLAINSADDERNPPELGIMERELRRLKNAKFYLIPSSEDTRGHGATGNAKFWKAQMKQWLDTAPGQ